MVDMLSDMYEITTAYQRSRAKRIFSLLENAAEEIIKDEVGLIQPNNNNNSLLNMETIQK